MSLSLSYCSSRSKIYDNNDNNDNYDDDDDDDYYYLLDNLDVLFIVLDKETYRYSGTIICIERMNKNNYKEYSAYNKFKDYYGTYDRFCSLYSCHVCNKLCYIKNTVYTSKTNCTIINTNYSRLKICSKCIYICFKNGIKQINNTGSDSGIGDNLTIIKESFNYTFIYCLTDIQYIINNTMIWEIKYHDYWPKINNIKVLSKFNKVETITFDKQILILLLISKYKLKTYYSKQHIFVKGIIMIIIKYLANYWRRNYNWKED